MMIFLVWQACLLFQYRKSLGYVSQTNLQKLNIFLYFDMQFVGAVVEWLTFYKFKQFKTVFREARHMNQLINLMDQQNHFFESNTTIRDELASTPYVRHYMQEESFSLHSEAKTDLPFNHLINQIVSELSILNKLIAANSKLTTSLLENGKDIFHKKKQFFQDFCHEYSIIGDTLALLPSQARQVFEYSAMALSNLILKLSINMAKISIVIVSRYLTPSYLNLFTTALLFEKYLELQLVRNKKFNSPEDHRHFLKQFPKITFLKIAKRRNPYDLEFVTRSQLEFNRSPFPLKPPSREPAEVCNVQLVEFYEQEEDIVLMTKRTPRRSGRHEAFALREDFGISAPYGHELLLLMAEIALPKIIDFKPDIIIYVEDFEGEQAVMDPQVRGLILNQLSEKVQHKIYVFREFGITEAMKLEWLNNHQEQEVPEFSYEFFGKVSSISMSTGASFIEESDKFPEERKLSIQTYLKQSMQITSDIFGKLHNHLKQKYFKASAPIGFKAKEPEKQFEQQLQKLHRSTLEDLTYLSLALIQKSNFEQTLTAYRNYIFPPKFLKCAIRWLTNQLTIIEGSGYSDVGEGYKSKIQQFRGMLELSNAELKRIQMLKFQPNFASAQPSLITTFFNFLTGKEEPLKVAHPLERQPRQLPVAKDDSFYIAYVEDYVILFFFAETYYGIYRKKAGEKYLGYVREDEYAGQSLGLSKKHSSCVANNRFFYKAFGEAKDCQLNTESEIYRIEIDRPEQLEKKDWVKVATSCITYSTDKNKKPAVIPIQFKRHGFGYTYDTFENEKKVNITLFGGGYNFQIENEEKVNRFFYIIRDHSNEVFKIGKTNGEIVNQSQNMRNKVLIYPFVYAIPFALGPNEIALLNTNGYLESINNFKKMFLTKVKTGPMTSLSSIGITAQNKLDYHSQSPEIAMANKNTVLAYLIHSYHCINRLNNRAALYNADGEIVLMECLKATEAEKLDIVRVSPINSKEMSENEDTLSLSFLSKKMVLK